MGKKAWHPRMTDFGVRPMEAEDIEEVLRIEQQSFSVPWSKAAFEAEVCSNDLAYYLVLTDKYKVVGYGGMWIIVDEAHVTNIAVLPDYRSRGLGKMLLDAMIKTAKAHGAGSMTLEVRASNLVAKQLYSKAGFKECGLRPGYYTDNNEDAIIMWCEELL